MINAIFSIQSLIHKTQFIFKTLGFVLALVAVQTGWSQTSSFKVEPPHWWVGMQEKSVELMVHGNEVATFNFKVLGSSARLLEQSSLDNANYVFLKLNLSNVSSAQTILIEGKNEKGDKRSFKYELKARSENSRERQGFDASDAIYLITPDRFSNGDPNNDNTLDTQEKTNRDELFGRYGGDIQGIINHVPYLHEMGFTAIWSSPLLTNDQEKYSYHGYAISDLYEIDLRFGTMQDYLQLSAALHEKDMKLIMDIIPNHIGDAHIWMKDMPAKDWFNNEGSFAATNHKRTVLHDPHSTEEDSTSFVNGWFVESMPDLNQRNRHMSTYLTQHAIWWIEQADLDGYRVDTYSYSDKEFLSSWSCAILNEYPNFNLVGEEWSLNPNFVSHWQQGSARNPGSCMPSMFDFPLQAAIGTALSDYGSWNNIYDAMAMDYLYPDPNNLMVFVDNHDMDRFYRQVNHDLASFKLGMTYLLTTRGIPQIYYGTEILLANEIKDNHGDIRMPFPGTWEGDTSNAITGEGLSADQKEAQYFVKKLLNFRKTSTAISKGTYKHFSPRDDVYVYFRISDDETLMIILNKNKEQVNLDLARFEAFINGKETSLDVLSGDVQPFSETMKLAPKASLVLKLK